jgi:uncharacterized protein YndB with AHSA1/START domain
MSALDRLISHPRRRELDHVDIDAPPAEVWERVRHGDLGATRAARALFAIRTIPDRLSGRRTEPVMLRIDDLVSTPERPGFQILVDDAPREVAVGAIGKVWRLAIPFRHLPTAEAFGSFAEPGWVRVAWALRVEPRGAGTRLEMELRVDATDDASWTKFVRYFWLIGWPSRFLRRQLLRSLARAIRTDASTRPLPGDDLLPDAAKTLTHAITIGAPPEEIWPWLVQMGCRRGGFYSIDVLDNAGVPSAREIRPELQSLAVGQILPATPRGDDGFEVLRIDAPRVLVLGGLFDQESDRQLPFAAVRPQEFWHMTWAFVLEPLGERRTRLTVRVRGAFSASQRLRAALVRPVHAIMQTAQLRNLAARAEHRA